MGYIFPTACVISQERHGFVTMDNPVTIQYNPSSNFTDVPFSMDLLCARLYKIVIQNIMTPLFRKKTTIWCIIKLHTDVHTDVPKNIKNGLFTDNCTGIGWCFIIYCITFKSNGVLDFLVVDQNDI